MHRYLCIHGHFYQPPRENPWLEDVELQDSAFPFHDWNERITAECYAPNSAARILDREGKVLDILDNYSLMSFNFGPTLLSWMQRHAPSVYQAVLDADRRSRERFAGHGSAMAQAYNHMIMPLANSRDKRTQILWGLRDFQHRFERKPEGMWLPETAVDLETLDLMAEQGLLFTVLTPYQAHRVRPLDPEGKGKWEDVTGGKIDPKEAYLCRLPSGRSISLFFYDGPVSQEVAFSGMLRRGEDFAHRLTGTFTERDAPQLVHIATDGETYGHHHRFGDMALAYCLRYAEERGLARLTVYGEFLKKHPPTREVKIFENTSWSCAHGVERWRSDCGCRIGGDGWNQQWRRPLRKALDWLRDEMIPLYEREMGKLAVDPWKTRDAYIEVILQRTPGAIRDFLHRHCGRELSREETVQALHLLEMQRHAMLMYTSCGWFFDDISGIETTQVLAYAGRALQLAQVTAGAELEEEFLAMLENAASNLPAWKNGAVIYRKAVKPARLDLNRVAAHHAIASLFQEDNGKERIYCYTAEDQEQDQTRSGLMSLSLGRTRIRSEVTLEEGEFSYAVLHFGAQSLNAGVRRCRGEEAFEAMRRDILEAFTHSDIPAIIRLMDDHFGTHNYTLWHLFRDEQRRVLGQIMALTLEDIENAFRAIYNNHFALARFLREINMPVPSQLAAPMELALNAKLRELFATEHPEPARIRQLAEDMEKVGVKVDTSLLERQAGELITARLKELSKTGADPDRLAYLNDLLDACRQLPLQMDLWEAQNLYFSLYRPLLSRLTGGPLESFRELGHKLNMMVD